MKKQPKLQSTSDQSTTGLDQGRSRVVIENVKREIDCGRFPAKRTVGERMTVEADIFADGHDALQGCRYNVKKELRPGLRLPCSRWSTTVGAARSRLTRSATTTIRCKHGSTASNRGAMASPRRWRPDKMSFSTCWRVQSSLSWQPSLLRARIKNY